MIPLEKSAFHETADTKMLSFADSWRLELKLMLLLVSIAMDKMTLTQ